MTTVLAIDPGNIESGWALINSECDPLEVGKTDNHELLQLIDLLYPDHTAIEMVASYGMAVGKEVFETCVWVGRFQQAITHESPVQLTYRRDVKMHHCGSAKAKDANITQALVDRFAPGQANHGKGTKAAPGFFYGFKADIWQAYALAVLAADRIENRPGVAA